MKKNCFCLILLCFCLMFSGCLPLKRQPITITFTDISGALSVDHTVKISFAEEKDYNSFYVDILVKADREVELTLFQEFAKEEDKVTLKVNNNFVSLDEYKLFNLQKEQANSMVGYGDVLVTTLVINSSEDANLTLLAVIGESSEGQFKKVAEVSKEYKLKVLKHTN